MSTTLVTLNLEKAKGMHSRPSGASRDRDGRVKLFENKWNVSPGTGKGIDDSDDNALRTPVKFGDGEIAHVLEYSSVSDNVSFSNSSNHGFSLTTTIAKVSLASFINDDLKRLQ